MGTIDFAHAARPEPADDVVATEVSTGFQCGRVAALIHWTV